MFIKRKKSLITLLAVIIAAVLVCVGALMLTPKQTAYAATAATEKPFEVTVDETPMGYDTFGDAWEAAKSADTATVTMLADAVIDAMLEVPNDSSITLDLNGYMLKYDSETDSCIIKVYGTMILEDNYVGTDRTYLVDNPTTDDPDDTVEIVGGVITGGHSSQHGGGIYIYGGGTFIMNGGTVAGNKATYTNTDNYANGGGVFLDVGCSFTMNGGAISYNNVWGAVAGIGGGVFAYQTTTKITGGTISHNKSSYQAGGLYAEFGSLVLEGGVISHNEAPYGGGMTLVDASTTMKISEITGNTVTIENNTAEYGGGIYFWKGTFTMEDGTISDNQAQNAGGVYVSGRNDDDVFKMKGGEISGNTVTNAGGGVYYSSGKFAVEGAVNITGNKKGTEDNNVYVIYNTNTQVSRIITVSGALVGAQIGFNLRAGHIGVFTGDYTEAGNTVAPSKYFISDSGNCVLLDNGEAKVSTSTHTEGEWIIDREAQIGVAGSKHKECTVCECVMQTEEIAPLIDKLIKPGSNGGENQVVVMSPSGFTPDIELVVIEIAKENYGAYEAIAQTVNGEIGLVYDVTLKSDGVTIQPDGTLTIRLLIPENLKGKTFKLFHLHEDAVADMEYTIDGSYAVVTTDKLSEFIFVGEKIAPAPEDSSFNPLWLILIIIVSLVIVGEVGYIVYRKVRKNKAAKGKK